MRAKSGVVGGQRDEVPGRVAERDVVEVEQDGVASGERDDEVSLPGVTVQHAGGAVEVECVDCAAELGEPVGEPAPVVGVEVACVCDAFADPGERVVARQGKLSRQGQPVQGMECGTEFGRAGVAVLGQSWPVGAGNAAIGSDQLIRGVWAGG